MATPPAISRKLQLTVTECGAKARVECSGRLVAEYTAAFKAEVKPLLTKGRSVVLDLTNLAYMDSGGLGSVVSLYVSAKSAGCELRLIHLNQRVRELLGLTHLLDAFGLCGEHMIRTP